MGKGGLNRLLLTPKDAAPQPPGPIPDDEAPAAGADTFHLLPSDPRTTHIRNVLARAAPFTLRVALEARYLHDAAPVLVRDDGGVTVSVPRAERRPPPRPPVALLVAMQRPKVIARVLEVAASLGVAVVCVVAADKVEKSYWDCKLFREDAAGARGADADDRDAVDAAKRRSPRDNDNANGAVSPPRKKRPAPDSEPSSGPTPATTAALPAATAVPAKPTASSETPATQDALCAAPDVPVPRVTAETALPGRARGPDNHPERDAADLKGALRRRADGLPAVRRRLMAGVEQACADASLPQIVLERGGLEALRCDAGHPVWHHVGADATRVVAHPYAPDGGQLASVSRAVATGVCGAVLAIGPEGGWTENEIAKLVHMGFVVAGMGERVLRSETAVVVGLGLVHEGLRLGESTREERGIERIHGVDVHGGAKG